MLEIKPIKVILIILSGLVLGFTFIGIIIFGFGTQSNFLGLYDIIDNMVEDEAPVVGSRAPDFELVNLNGELVRLSEYEGKPVLINFWATWCAPCVLEMPNILKYYEEFFPNFVVFAVNAGETRQEIQTFVDDMGLTFDVLMDPESQVQYLYRLRGYPTSFFIDADRMIRVQHIGMLTENQLVDYLLEVGVSW